MAKNRYSNGARRRNLRARIQAEGMPCHLCGYPIPDDVPVMHPQYLVLDERVPFRDGGSATARSNVEPAHRCCNGWRGTKPLTPQLRARIKKRYECEVLGTRKQASPVAFETSQRW